MLEEIDDLKLKHQKEKEDMKKSHRAEVETVCKEAESERDDLITKLMPSITEYSCKRSNERSEELKL